MIYTALTFAVLYGLVLVFMYTHQRKLMYFPEKLIASPNEYGVAAQEVAISSEDGTRLHGWYSTANEGMVTIVYFHGNAGHIGDRSPLFAALQQKGLGVVMFNYRGYGKSEGAPDEQGIFSDARSVVQWLRERGIALTDMAFFGESLGTGVAIKMATEFTPKALFLQAPYTSVAGRAAEIYWYLPVKWLLQDQFDSLSRIKSVQCPITIFHGERDNVIPVTHGKTLLDAANEPKQGVFFDEIEHNNFDSSVISQHVLDRLRSI